MSAIENAKLKIVKQRFSLQELLTGLATLYTTQCREKKIQFGLRQEGIQDYAGEDVRVLTSVGCDLFRDRTEHLALTLDRLAEAKNKGDVELFFVEAALLIESGYEHIVDEMWYIYAREDVRRRRLSESRGYTPEKIEKIIASQLSEEEFRQHCDFVIDNSDSLEDSYRQIRQKLEAYSWKE